MNTILQNILLPTDELCSTEEVYFHTDPDGTCIDFDGYFNLFYIEKHKRYTKLKGVSLILVLRGYDSITLMHNRDEIQTYYLHNKDIDTKANITVLKEIATEDDGAKKYSVNIPYDEFDEGVFWFRLRQASTDEDKYIQGYYEGAVDTLRTVRLFVDICTYKREEYVHRNLKRMTEYLSKKENRLVAENLHVALIDNGRTLKNDSRISEIVDSYNISIIENKNTGGSGGFTRGMMEAIAKKEELGLTHILLMDDDASYDMELFTRLFGLLQTLKDDYKDITVGGALWREDYPFIQHASGEWYEKMSLYNPMPCMDMRSYEECTQDGMCETSNEFNRYSGWWCCCYSLNTVRSDNLPLQVFVRGDDIEYEKRARISGNPIVFLNGIGVWHSAFDGEYAGIKRYYDVRNYLILTVRHEKDLSKRFIANKVGFIMLARCLRRRYTELELEYMGAMDFLKGREWLDSLDPEEHHQKLIKNVRDKIHFVPVKDIEVENKSEIINEIHKITPESTLEKLLKLRFVHPGVIKFIFLCIRNGMIGPYHRGASLATPEERIWAIDRHYRKTVLYAPSSGTAMVARADFGQLIGVWKMYRSFSRELKRFDMDQWRV